MVNMSRAVMAVTDPLHSGRTLRDIPTPELREYVEILSAFAADFRDELNRRPDKDRP